jgi:prepilin-type N-terminal cleavage/methylation domain-containing protein
MVFNIKMSQVVFKRGFTIMEILVVMGIIVVLSALIFANFKASTKTLALQRATHKLSQDLKWVQKMALGAERVTKANILPGRYGIYLNTSSPRQYIIFADCNDDDEFNDAKNCKAHPEGEAYPEELEKVMIEEGVKLEKLYLPKINQATSSLTVLFERTTLWVLIKLGNEAEITLALEDDPNSSSTIYINRAGLIGIKD